MPAIEHDFGSTCTPEALWAVLSDLTSVAQTNPTVRSVDLVGSQRSGIGATRRCELNPKGSVTERVAVYREGRAIGFEVIASDWPVSDMRWITSVEPGATGVRLRQTLTYQMKYGPFGWVLNKRVLQRAIRNNVGLALQRVIAEAESRA